MSNLFSYSKEDEEFFSRPLFLDRDRNVTTTQIYADLANAKKRETVNKITLK